MVEVKKCTKCGDTKKLEEFNKRIAGISGVTSRCKKCKNKYGKAYKRTFNGLVSKIYGSQRTNSKGRGHKPPNYTNIQLREWVINQPNSESLFNNWVSSGFNKDLAPSVDRLYNNLPYTMSNIQLITWKENRDKSYMDRINGVDGISKSVIGTHIETGVEIRFHSLNEARRNGYSQGNVCQVINGMRKTHAKHTWRYEF